MVKLCYFILDSFENFDVLSSEAIEFSAEDETNLVSPSVKFPDKVHMSLSIHSDVSGKNLPKLDFTKVREKYLSTIMKVEKKEIKLIADKTSEYNSNNTIINGNEDEIALKKHINDDNKIKSELKILHKTNENLKLKVDKYKKLYQDTKTTLIVYSNSLKIANTKIEMLETQVKKISVMPTTEDTVNKRDRNNTSMVHLYF